MVYMMTTTITIHDGTKERVLSYGNMGETYDMVINRLLTEVKVLDNIVTDLTDELSTKKLSVNHFDKDERSLIFSMLDGPLQSDDDNVRDPAESIEIKLQNVRDE